MRIRTGPAAAIASLAAQVDELAGCPIVGRNAETDELAPDAQQTTTMSDVLVHPKDASLAAYVVTDRNRDLVAQILGAPAEDGAVALASPARGVMTVDAPSLADIGEETDWTDEWAPPPPPGPEAQ